MTGEKSKFMSLSENKSRNVTFGNDAPGKIRGKGMVSLSNGKGKAQNVLTVVRLDTLHLNAFIRKMIRILLMKRNTHLRDIIRIKITGRKACVQMMVTPQKLQIVSLLVKI